MSGILKRTVFYVQPHRFKGEIAPMRFIGWAKVVTGLGTMMEPFNIDDRFNHGMSVRDFDPSDPMSRVDGLQNVPEGQEYKILSFGSADSPHNGGDLRPRVHNVNGNF
jgi:hypothetical protein